MVSVSPEQRATIVHSPAKEPLLPFTCATATSAFGGWGDITAVSLPVTVCGSPRIVPPPVRQFSVVFNPFDVATGDDFPTAMLQLDDLGQATPIRQFEYLTGRVCVAEALRMLGVQSFAPLRRRSNGTPVWPAGTTGSITHTRGFVSAAVASTTNVAAIGIDSEAILPPERALRVAGIFATATELAVARAAGLGQEHAVTLIFSAKEAIFKALHAFVHRIFDFHDVQIVRVDGVAREYTASVVQTLAPAFPAGFTLNGRFDIDSRRIHTGMIVAPLVRE